MTKPPSGKNEAALSLLMSPADRRRFGVKGRGDTLRTVGGNLPVRFLSPASVAPGAVVACMPWRDPPVAADNLRATCLACGIAIQHRPEMPRAPLLMCISCAAAWATAH